MAVWGALAILGGLLGFGASIREAVVQYRLQRDGVRVGGLVVRHHMRSGKDGPTYFAVVEFVDSQGGRHTFQSLSSGVRGLPVGGGVPVRYSPASPEGARIDLTRRRVWDVAFPAAVGAVLAGAGIWVFATGR
ncbi:DUF3592 domain-containing protein [Streptomyces sp. NPDC050560]|uniref:DUF3592 domain-containing protein n=1 Tax=Streptomyces sp. NPDC050560 TaxID=3365630 RepID=UPI00379F0D39